jgi:molybdopterin synthase catalytic subunit
MEETQTTGMKERKAKKIYLCKDQLLHHLLLIVFKSIVAKLILEGTSIFLGQVRADKIEGKEVASIEYTAYEDMAMEKNAFDP